MKMLVVPFLGVFFAIGFGLLGTGLHLLKRSMRAAKWPIVPGVITSLEMRESTDGEGATSHEVKVRYAYKVNGVDYEGDRLAFGYAGSSGRDAHEEIRRKLADAEVVAVRHDPADPSTSCLSCGLHRSIQFMLAFAITWLLFITGFAAMAWLFSRPDSVLLDNLLVRGAAAKPPGPDGIQ